MLRAAGRGLAFAALALTVSSALAISQSGEQKNMRRVGHTDLQGRPSYQPNFIDYPDGRVIAFIGTHGGSAKNTLKPGSPVENNGTMIVDITNPERPFETAHIPVPVAGGQAQMARMCLGQDIGGLTNHVYLLRNIQGSSAAGYEIWDVTDVKSPAPVAALRGIRSTHKDWWECKGSTPSGRGGIAYMPGSKSTPPLWRTSQSMLIYDWGNPPLATPGATTAPVVAGYPKYIRTYGVVGAQPLGAVRNPGFNPAAAPPNSLHGAISAFEHPQKDMALARAAGPDDKVGNRIYAAWGVGDDGILQIIDRKKLLPSDYGGTWAGSADLPSDAELEAAQAGILYMSPDQGGHTSMPVFGLQPKSYENFTEFLTRDIVLLSSESTADQCKEAPHWAFIVDVTVENSKTAPPGTKVEENKWQGPMVLSTMSVDPRAGEKYPRGNYCLRGARFGVHSVEENFRNPYYGRLTFIAYFTGGVRAWDIREPQEPAEVGFYVPESNANTSPDGYMTNNVEVDNRGIIIVCDRNGAGLDLIELHGKAKEIGLGRDEGRKHDHDDHDD